MASVNASSSTIRVTACAQVCLVFYEAMHPTVAINVASSWLEAMNDHKHASNIDKAAAPRSEPGTRDTERHCSSAWLV